ncbi:unnamed protein product, partial [Mycena citricolor]
TGKKQELKGRGSTHVPCEAVRSALPPRKAISHGSTFIIYCRLVYRSRSGVRADMDRPDMSSQYQSFKPGRGCIQDISRRRLGIRLQYPSF